MTGLSRCPFCHASVDFAAAAWVACAGCLARHHASCWEESRVCSSCGDPRPLATAEKGTRPRRPWGVAAGILIAVAAQAVGGAILGARITRCRAECHESCVDHTRVGAERISELELKVDGLLREACREAGLCRDRGAQFESNRSYDSQRIDANSQRIDRLDSAVHEMREASRKERSAAIDEGLRALCSLMEHRADTIEPAEMLAELSCDELSTAREGVLRGGIKSDDVADLARFAAAKKRGALTQDEFDRVKAVILAKR